MQTFDITTQFAPAHLERLPNLAVEITGGLGELWQRSDRRKPLVADKRAACKNAHPAAFEHPTPLRFQPASPGCKDASPDLNRRRIDFQHGEPAKKILGGV